MASDRPGWIEGAEDEVVRMALHFSKALAIFMYTVVFGTRSSMIMSLRKILNSLGTLTMFLSSEDSGAKTMGKAYNIFDADGRPYDLTVFFTQPKNKIL